MSYDFAQCTTLCSLNIVHKGFSKAAVSIPPFLTRLCLNNVMPGTTDLDLHHCDDIVIVKLGGITADSSATRCLPILPCSTVELELCGTCVAYLNLQELTRLTNLKKLTMPDPPTQQQVQTIRQLHQLRWLNVYCQLGDFTKAPHLHTLLLFVFTSICQ